MFSDINSVVGPLLVANVKVLNHRHRAQDMVATECFVSQFPMIPTLRLSLSFYQIFGVLVQSVIQMNTQRATLLTPYSVADLLLAASAARVVIHSLPDC